MFGNEEGSGDGFGAFQVLIKAVDGLVSCFGFLALFW